MTILYDSFNKAPSTFGLSAKVQKVLFHAKQTASSPHREKAEQDVAKALVIMLPKEKNSG